jgi:hypothetical protein
MNPRERFLATMRFEEVDRPPISESHPWGSALRRWQREGLGENNYPPMYAECENNVQFGVDLWMRPRFEVRNIADDGEFITSRTEYGVVQRVPKSADMTAMPEHIDYPVKSAEDWSWLKEGFVVGDAQRFPDDWDARCARWKSESPVLIFQARRAPSLFGFVRELMGPERTLYAFYDEPDLIDDIMETQTEMVLDLIPKVVADAPLTAFYFWEDMCYKGGPLISPDMFRKFMMPRYKRITKLLRGLGIDIIFVDSDGDVSALIPLWLESGINGVYPMEVAAGMDVVALRKKYGKHLLMTGGIDKRVLAKDRHAIDTELERKIPLALEGGYIPHIDHSVPHDVPYENMLYYWGKKKELLGVMQPA